MPKTYEPIANATGTGASGTISFTTISGSYTDLILVLRGTTSALTNLNMTFNSDTGNNYSGTYLYGNGTSALSNRESNRANIIVANNATFTSTQANCIVHIMNYSNSTTNKTVLARANRSDNATEASVGLWRSTAAITTVTVTNGGNFDTNFTAVLYGIKAA